MPTCELDEVIHPRSGEELARFTDTGLGRLVVDNGTANDAVVVLVDAYTGRPYRAIYVRSRERGIFTRVARGSYRLQFQLGQQWLRTRQFCQPSGASEFAEKMLFTERRTSDGIMYDAMSITLHTVAGGTARIDRLPAGTIQLPLP